MCIYLNNVCVGVGSHTHVYIFLSKHAYMICTSVSNFCVHVHVYVQALRRNPV